MMAREVPWRQCEEMRVSADRSDSEIQKPVRLDTEWASALKRVRVGKLAIITVEMS